MKSKLPERADNLTPEGLMKGSPEAAQRFDQQQFLQNICKPSLSHSKDARKRYDYEWMVRDMFRRGYQFSRWQPSTNTITLASRQQARIPVNILASQMRSIRNQVTSFRPKFEVLPRNLTEESKVQARYSGRLLDYLFDHLKLKDKIKKTITQGLMFSIGGPWQIYYDEEKEEVRVWLIDPFDFYFDPLAESLEDAEFCIKAVRRPLSEVITNQQFDKWARKEVTGGESRLAVSEYKQFMIQSLRYVNQYNQGENPTVILFEGDFKIRDKDTGKVHIRKVIWTDQNTKPLFWEDTDNDEYDYVIYHADLNPKEIYGEGWMRHTMPINRVINSLESSVYEYNNRIAKGRIVVDRDSGVRAIHNVHGEIISKNRGAEVRALDMPALPVAVSHQIDRMNRYMEDIGGAHDACVDKDTEILTKSGWKNYLQIKEGEEIISYDSKNDTLTNDTIKKIYTYDKENEYLVHIKNKNIDALVTKNHRWAIFSDSGIGKFNKKQFKETKDLKTSDHIPLSAMYEENKIYMTPDRIADVGAELAGWVITEGSYDKRKGNRMRIIQSKKHKEECRQIEGCLRTIFKEKYNKPYETIDGCYQWHFSSEWIKKEFPNKELTYEFINKLDWEGRKWLYEIMLMGDGTEIDTKTLYWSTSKQNSDAFQYLCTLLGYNTRQYIFDRSTPPTRYIRGSGKFKDLYVISVKDQTKFTGFSSDTRKQKFVQEELYSGVVWCPETNNGTFIARRNGYVFITGNSLGRVPAGVKSGIGVAELKQADSTNQDDLVDNMEDFLTECGMKILKKIAKNYKKYKVIQHLGYQEEDTKYFAVVGQSAKKKGNIDEQHKNQIKVGPDWIDLAIIGEDNNIRVTIGSWLGYTKDMMQEKVIKYAQLGLIDQKTALRLLEFGNINEIVEQTRVELLLKKNVNTPPQPGANPGEQDQYGLAMTENEMIVFENKPVPVSENDDHLVHLALHQEALGRGNDELLKVHMDKHSIYLGQGPKLTQTDQSPPEDQMRNAQVAGQAPPPPEMGGLSGQAGIKPAIPLQQTAGMTQAEGLQALPPRTASIAQQIQNVPNA